MTCTMTMTMSLWSMTMTMSLWSMTMTTSLWTMISSIHDYFNKYFHWYKCILVLVGTSESLVVIPDRLYSENVSMHWAYNLRLLWFDINIWRFGQTYNLKRMNPWIVNVLLLSAHLVWLWLTLIHSGQNRLNKHFWNIRNFIFSKMKFINLIDRIYLEKCLFWNF